MILIRSHQKICGACVTHWKYNRHSFRLLSIVRYSPYLHSITKKQINRCVSKIHSQASIINKQEDAIQELKAQISQMQSDIHYKLGQSSRYQRRPLQVEDDFIEQFDRFQQEAQQLIPVKSQSNRWLNRLQIELNSEQDCLYWTGQGISDILFQSKRCKLNPFWIFQTRVRLYRYLPYKLQSLIFGLSETHLNNKIHETFPLMDSKYALYVLVHGDTNHAQTWTREKIKEHTPDFVYTLYDTDRESAEFTILSQDSTYQFIQTCQSNHQIRKATLNMHKNKRHLLKFHIIGCADGLPMFGMLTFGDGHHSDGTIWRASMDPVYVRACLDYLEKHGEGEGIGRKPVPYRKTPRGTSTGSGSQPVADFDDELKFDCTNFSFRTKQTCRALLNLQRLLNIEHGDQAVMDNGYQIQHPCAHATKQAAKPFHRLLTPLEASHQRTLVYIRQTQERINKYLKRNNMLRSVITVEDIPLMQAAWNIAMADMVHNNVILMKDDENSQAFAKRLIDYRYVDVNPADFYEPARGEFAHKKLNLKQTVQPAQDASTRSLVADCNRSDIDSDIASYDADESEIDSDIAPEDDEEREFTVQEQAVLRANKKDYVQVAVGFDNIQKWLQQQEWLQYLFDDIQEIDLVNSIGKGYKCSLTHSYLRRMHLYTANLTLRQHKENKFVLMLDNIKSRYKSAQRYYNIINLMECYYYKLSLAKLSDDSIMLPHDQQHWFKWLRSQSTQNNVSQFLHPIYIQRVKLLRERNRILRQKRRKYVIFGIDFAKFNLAMLRWWFKEEGIALPPPKKKHTKQQLRDHLIQTLRDRYNEPDCLVYRGENWGYFTREDILFKYQQWNVEVPDDESSLSRAYLRDHLLTILKNKQIDSLQRNTIRESLQGSVIQTQCAQPCTESTDASSESDGALSGSLSDLDYAQTYFKKKKLHLNLLHRPFAQCSKPTLQAFVEQKVSTSLRRKYVPSKAQKKHYIRVIAIYHHRKRTNASSSSSSDESEPLCTPSPSPEPQTTRLTRKQSQWLAQKPQPKPRHYEALCAAQKKKISTLNVDVEYDRFDEDILEYVDDTRNKPERSQLPVALRYMADYPEAKLWWDLDFSLMDSKLARIQTKCRCASGQPVPGLCAHTGTWLRLLFYSVKRIKDIDKIICESPRDRRIFETVHDMKPYKEFLKCNEELFWKAKGCFCRQAKDEATFLCQGCDVYYHPSCIGSTEDEIRDNTWTERAFFCNNCHINKVFMAKHLY